MAKLEWKTTRLQVPEGKVTLTHDARQPVEPLVRAVFGPAHPLTERVVAETVQKTKKPPWPELKIVPWGAKGLLAVRSTDARLGGLAPRPDALWDMVDAEDEKRAKGIVSPSASWFPLLQHLVDKHSAILEMPVAHIELQAPGKVAQRLVVSTWKKGTRSLHDYLKDGSISPALRKRACIRAVQRLAQLHAAGVLHGHPKSSNFVIDPSTGHVQLVDYSVARLGRSRKDRQGENLYARDNLVRSAWSALDATDRHEHAYCDSFYATLENAYADARRRYARDPRFSKWASAKASLRRFFAKPKPLVLPHTKAA